MKLIELKPYTQELNLLIVEDEEPNLNQLASIFSRIFKKVDKALNGLEALALIEKNSNYDMIITDLTMPKMNGIEMISEIRKTNFNIPIIVLSAHNESDKLLQLINAGVDGFIQKPMNTEAAAMGIYRAALAASDHKLIEQYHAKIEEQNLFLSAKFKELEKNPNNNIQFQTNLNLKSNSEYYAKITQQDTDEIVELAQEIEDAAFLSLQKIADKACINLLTQRLNRFCNILNKYDIFASLSKDITKLSVILDVEYEGFLDKQTMVAPFLDDVASLLCEYSREVWGKPTDNPNFYDASIRKGVDSISAILKKFDRKI